MDHPSVLGFLGSASIYDKIASRVGFGSKSKEDVNFIYVHKSSPNYVHVGISVWDTISKDRKKGKYKHYSAGLNLDKKALDKLIKQLQYEAKKL